MAIKKLKDLNKGKLKVDLTGPEGNAYCLMGYAKNFSKQLGLDWPALQKEMMSGDYENLLQVFDREFGDYVDLYR